VLLAIVDVGKLPFFLYSGRLSLEARACSLINCKSKLFRLCVAGTPRMQHAFAAFAVVLALCDILGILSVKALACCDAKWAMQLKAAENRLGPEDYSTMPA
jgi:hypothetical protein